MKIEKRRLRPSENGNKSSTKLALSLRSMLRSKNCSDPAEQPAKLVVDKRD